MYIISNITSIFKKNPEKQSFALDCRKVKHFNGLLYNQAIPFISEHTFFFVFKDHNLKELKVGQYQNQNFMKSN